MMIGKWYTPKIDLRDLRGSMCFRAGVAYQCVDIEVTPSNHWRVLLDDNNVRHSILVGRLPSHWYPGFRDATVNEVLSKIMTWSPSQRTY